MSKLQNGCKELAEEFYNRVIQAGELLDDGTYRYGNDEVTGEQLLKRSINNLALLSKNHPKYRASLVDVSDERIMKNREILEAQIKLIARNNTDEKSAAQLSADLADVLLTSWHLIVRV